MPLGAAALAGTTYPIDRAYTVAELLGSPGSPPTAWMRCPTVISSWSFWRRQHLHGAPEPAVRGTHVLWSTAEFGFIDPAGRFRHRQQHHAPEKESGRPRTRARQNRSGLRIPDGPADPHESLPMAYNRDMQEDKEPLFDAVDTLKACLAINARMIPRITVNRETMRRAASVGFLNATDMADYLVGQGCRFERPMPASAMPWPMHWTGKGTPRTSLDELKSFSSLIEADLFDHLTLTFMVDRRQERRGDGKEKIKGR
jgi:argininosuccinate lyase